MSCRAQRHAGATAPRSRTCAHAARRLGGGTGLIDARDALRALDEPVPFGFSIFLSRGTIPGAVAAFTVLGSADERAPIVRRYPVVAGVHAVVTENLVSDPTPDGLYGKKLVIYTGPINGFQVSIAEVDATVRTLRIRKGECVRVGRGGRCERRQRADATLFDGAEMPRVGALQRAAVRRLPAAGRQLDDDAGGALPAVRVVSAAAIGDRRVGRATLRVRDGFEELGDVLILTARRCCRRCARPIRTAESSSPSSSSR